MTTTLTPVAWDRARAGDIIEFPSGQRVVIDSVRVYTHWVNVYATDAHGLPANFTVTPRTAVNIWRWT